ncbi:MAG: LPS export ABC transporter permease LptG [Nitrospirota bacterium]
MKILSKYIIESFLRTFILCMSTIIVLYIIVDLVENLEYFIRHKVFITYIIQFFILKFPMIIFQTSPVAILLSTLFTLGVLSKNSEITAMKASGISLYNVINPLLALTFFISIFILLGNETIVPYATQKFYRVKYLMIEKKPQKIFFKQDKVWFRDSGNAIFNIQLLDAKNSQFKGISVYKFDSEFNLTARIDAKEMVYEEGKWHLIEGVLKNFLKDRNIDIKPFDKEYISLDKTPEEFKKTIKNPDEMSFAELRNYVARLRQEGFNVTRYVVDLYAKTAIPFANFILCLIAIPFALKSSRSSGIIMGIGISTIIAFLYIIILSFGISLGKGGILPPLLAAWLANIIFSTAGAVMLISTRQ